MSRLEPGIYTPEEVSAIMMDDPEPHPIGPDEVRVLLRECVTVVKPGEVLVVRTRRRVTAADSDRFRQHVAAFNKANGVGLKAMLLTADELAVVADPSDVSAS